MLGGRSRRSRGSRRVVGDFDEVFLGKKKFFLYRYLSFGIVRDRF